MKPFVVNLDTCSEHGIRSVECYVFAEDAEAAKKQVYDWLNRIVDHQGYPEGTPTVISENVYHNAEAIKVRGFKRRKAQPEILGVNWFL